MNKPKTQLTSYAVQYSNADIAEAIAKIEDSTMGLDRDLMIVALVVMALCLSDPELSNDSVRFQNALDSVANHICWVLQSGSANAPIADPKLMN